MSVFTKATLIQVPYDSGRYGWRMGAGPLAWTRSGLSERLERIGCAADLVEVRVPEAPEPGHAFALARAVASAVRGARAEGALPVVLAGNCLMTVGAVAGAQPPPRVLWLDAHGDFNTPETSASGFLDGMALAVLTGRCWRAEAARVDGFRALAEERVALAAARALDPEEERELRRSAVSRIPAAGLVDGVARFLAEDPGGGEVHLHVDIDCLDPSEGVANALATAGGVTLDALLEVVRVLRSTTRVASVTLSAYDPDVDREGRVREAGLRVIERVLEPVPDPRAAKPESWRTR